MKKSKKKVRKQARKMADVFACSLAVDQFAGDPVSNAVEAFALAFDESKHPRGEKGTRQGGRFVKLLGVKITKDTNEHGEERHYVTPTYNRGGIMMTVPDDKGFATRAEAEAHEQHIRKRAKMGVHKGSQSARRMFEGAANAASDEATFQSDRAGRTGLKSHHAQAADAHLFAAEVHDKQGNRTRAAFHRIHAKNHEEKSKQGFRLSQPADSLGFDAIISLSHGDGDVQATSDPLTFWKEIAHVGKFYKGSQEINITPRHLKHWAGTFKAMSQVGIKVPVPVEHTENPERKRGEVLAMITRENRKGVPALYARIKFRDADAAKMKDSGTSIYVPTKRESGLGHHFVSPVTHVAVTDYPVIPDLEPFSQALSLSLTSDVSGVALAYDPDEERDEIGRWTGPGSADIAKRRSKREQAADAEDHASAKSLLKHIKSLGFTASRWAGNYDKGNVRVSIHGDDGRASLTVFDGKPGNGHVKYDMNLPFASGKVAHKIIEHVLAQESGTAMSLSHNFNPNTSAIVMDAASRTGALNGITLSFPPNNDSGGNDKPDASGGDKPLDKASPPANQKAPQQQPPNGATQQITLRDLATSLGIDQSITDETQLLTLVANVVAQLKARAQAPIPPQQPFPNPMMPRPPMPPSPMASQPPQMHPAGQFGPPALHTGRPPMQMSRNQFKRHVAELAGVALSLDDIPEEIVMALSKKQMKKVIKTIKKGKKGSVSGDKDVVQKLNDKPHFGTRDDVEGGDYDDTYKDEGNDAFDNDDGNIDSDDALDGSGRPGKLSMGSMALSGSVLDAVKNSRKIIIDNLFSQGYVNAHVRKSLMGDFVDSGNVALSHQYDDGFDRTVQMIMANGKVMNTGKSGIQAAGGTVVALSNGDLSESNPVLADAERRAAGKSNL